MTSFDSAAAARLLDGPATFMNAPHVPDARGAGVGILGIPFDCGIHPFRIGARQGPEAIRAQSGLIRRYHPERADYDLIAALNVVDCGSVRLTPSRMEDSFAAIVAAADGIFSNGVVPIGLGGDGSISLPMLRAAARHHSNLVVLHIDSHTDAYPPDAKHPYDASTQFTHAALEQRLSTGRSYHIGLRGSTTRSGCYDYGRELGYNLITMEAFWQSGPQQVIDEIRERAGDLPVYLSWDMDVFDPSCAPGVCTPIWGGFSAREGLAFLRALSGLNIVGADVNTVSPPHDVNGMTAFLAAEVVFQILLLLDARRKGETA